MKNDRRYLTDNYDPYKHVPEMRPCQSCGEYLHIDELKKTDYGYQCEVCRADEEYIIEKHYTEDKQWQQNGNSAKI